ncbi:MAG: ATP-binding protein [Treponema sp.]|nr:ATP-binding protein [Treponema sp.]
MLIEREKYLKILVNSKNNGLIKVITGIRRCGKSFILFYFFYDHLIESGVDEENIIAVPLDDEKYREYCDPEKLYAYIREKIRDESQKYYVLIDEAPDAISKKEIKNPEASPALYSVLNRLNKMQNVDIYLTGSNSRYLSSKIMSDFQGCGEEIHVAPLSFSEYHAASKKELDQAWKEYLTYGGLPHILSESDGNAKSAYLEKMIRDVYLKDICERYDIRNKRGLQSLLELLATKCGESVNPQKILETFEKNGTEKATMPTIANFLLYLQEAFLVKKSGCHEIKGRREISTQTKYYFSDLGIRNAFLSLRGAKEPGDKNTGGNNASGKNAIYNEMICRGFELDSGIIETRANVDGKKIRRQLEIDFVAKKDGQKYYIQVAGTGTSLMDLSRIQSTLLKIPDSFKKIIVVNEKRPLWRTEQGITVISILDFLLNPDSLNL